MPIEIADEISVFVAELNKLYNKSLKTGDVPQDWKLANVMPIFKKIKRSSPVNYEPVSLTVILCTVLESLIRDKVIEHLDIYKLRIHNMVLSKIGLAYEFISFYRTGY